MCGRFTLKTPAEALARAFGGSAADYPPPRYNIAPGMPILALRLAPRATTRETVPLRWGLIPGWAKDPAMGNRLINARAETVAEKPSFRGAFRQRRCLVLADGFYEWQRGPRPSQPHYVALRSGHPFAFAALWERWSGAGEAIESCTILTTEASARLRPIHHRMPVILEPEDYALWLDVARFEPDRLQSLLHPYMTEDLEAYPVATTVNDPRHDSPACIERMS